MFPAWRQRAKHARRGIGMGTVIYALGKHGGWQVGAYIHLGLTQASVVVGKGEKSLGAKMLRVGLDGTDLRGGERRAEVGCGIERTGG